jgi:hypothetical protein
VGQTPAISLSGSNFIQKFEHHPRQPAREKLSASALFLVLPVKQSACALCVGFEPPERCEEFTTNERDVSRGTMYFCEVMKQNTLVTVRINP